MTESGGPDALIAALGLEPHPEGGRFRETWRDQAAGARGSGTAIYYLLQEGEVSAWHRIDATEIWHHYAGAPLALTLRRDGTERRIILGPDVAAGERPQAIVPARAWQTAKSLGAWTLVGCTVSPAFEFSGFELAPGDGPPD
ncbi:MAG: cupin domain-containing protein [Alphaproteobacteria bacterium]|nr:cupin domain-containing protein [Alphaproteobacteria bacterium]